MGNFMLKLKLKIIQATYKMDYTMDKESLQQKNMLIKVIF